MKIMPFCAVAPNIDKVPHSNDFFDTVKYRYHEYADEGLFMPTEAEAMYIYQIKDEKGHKRTGLVVTTDIQEYFDGKMRPHEKTIDNNEELQTELLKTRGAAIKPILLTHEPVDELTKLIENYIEKHKKFYVIELGNEKHRFWQITERLIFKKISSIFAEKIPHVYLADGHHRSASFAALHQLEPTEKTKKMLCAYFPETQIEINAFHRIVSDLNGLSADDFLEELRKIFKIKVLKDGALPNAKFELTMFLDGKWFRLNWRKEVLKNFSDKMVQLDVDLLNEKVLKPILRIKNTNKDGRLTYINGHHTLNELAEKVNTEGVGFYLCPIEMEDLKEVVDGLGTLPAKSTFFEPRMKNGLLVYDI